MLIAMELMMTNNNRVKVEKELPTLRKEKMEKLGEIKNQK